MTSSTAVTTRGSIWFRLPRRELPARERVIAGSAKHLHFVEVDLATGLAMPGGCASTIASITFGP